MNIFCIGDSLGLPRNGVVYEDTWYYLLTKRFPNINFYPFFYRDQTTSSLEHIFNNYLKYYNAKFVIVQLGICDCAPRIINKDSLFWKTYFKVFQLFHASDLAWRIVKSTHSRNNPNRVVVPFDLFKTNVLTFVSLCKERGISIILVKIATPTQSLQKKSPLITGNIVKYNSFYDELKSLYPDLISVVNPLNTGEITDYVEDGYHTTAIGFKKVFDSLSKIIQEV